MKAKKSPPTTNSTPADDAKKVTKELTQEEMVKALVEKAGSLETNWKRALADYQNLLRRVDHDKKEFVKMSNANLIARLIPSLDVLEMAASHTQDVGVQMAAKQFNQALIDEGLKTIEPKPGDRFDPAFHECIEALEVAPEQSQDTVAELVLKGYNLGDYVLRPARVKVYKKIEQNHE